MDANRGIELEQRIVLVDLLSSLFLTLPDEALLESLLTLEWGESDSAGSNEIAAYIEERRDADREELLLELGRDRARLMRGANNEGMRSAYESLYSATAANESIGSLNRFYADAGFALAEGVHDTVDQIGVEMAFCSVLMKRESEALRQGDEAKADEWREVRMCFMAQHLGRWVHNYVADMRTFALTGFYRGVALLIDEAF
ncbi:hypothetical protein C2L80_09330 [Rubneribacter badeniensis]|uniref:Molecular chaperone TorD n=2 Tax=Rubneribacter badeniensis TaxID=2070688 RepID=A0A2K2U3S5_9ACTN|nr:hypothetical protein B5F41_03575 [Gordonibacter sp. An232A]PNV64929.1 hypothetical protein C2L80_09330 [Rubneribacter badeniensis]CVH74743.1 chaperone protein TorD [Coriobacteriaceae bacterium CHKCI002]